jgi:sodium/hydrogen antiporter
MHEHPIIIFTALLIFVFGLFSRLSERSPVTAPMVFVALGMTISPYGIDFLKAGINAPWCGLLLKLPSSWCFLSTPRPSIFAP